MKILSKGTESFRKEIKILRQSKWKIWNFKTLQLRFLSKNSIDGPNSRIHSTGKGSAKLRIEQ
jgi:hypothetical protein